LLLFHSFIYLGPSRLSRSADRCDDPGNCIYHNPVVSPIRMRRVRGDPPSLYIPRPYLNGVIRANTSSTTTPVESHDALLFLLGNVRKVFVAFEASLNELDAWRRYYDFGN